MAGMLVLVYHVDPLNSMWLMWIKMIFQVFCSYVFCRLGLSNKEPAENAHPGFVASD
ncbi:MAG: hypothetical protein ACI9CF_001997 [Candidatus Omnitrophota bacterium]